MERLLERHELAVFTSADALGLLRRRFADQPQVQIREIPGLVFQYTGGRLDVLRSIRVGLDYQARTLGPLVDQLMTSLEAFAADLVITDFEPALPRAAKRLGVPLVSVDHQHFLLAYDLGTLPWLLRMQAWLMSNAVWMYVSEPNDTVISAFFRPPLRRGWEHAVQVGPLIRREICQQQPSDGRFILSYLRKHTPFETIQALDDCGMPVKVYGLGQRAAVGNVTFHGIEETRFVEDLAGCHAVISAAGNQLIGETLHLGKPILVLPERAHAEQLMNSHFLTAMGCGRFCLLEEVTTRVVRTFLEDADQFLPALAGVRGRLDGTDRVVEVVERRLLGRVSDAA